MKRILGIFLVVLCFVTVGLYMQRDKVQKVIQSKGDKVSLVSNTRNWILQTPLKEIIKKEQEKEQKEQEKRNQYMDALIVDMTLEEKIAQLMILTNEKDITDAVMHTYQPGGVIFFAPDFKDKTVKEVADRVAKLQASSAIPLFIGVDEEGGAVSRIVGLKDKELPVFASARQLFEEGGTSLVKEDARVKAKWLEKMGINLNFDPVADVVSNPNAYMYERSASGEPEEVSEYVTAVIKAMTESNLGCCIKHFPGYGNNANTHLTYATDSKKLVSYQHEDLLPFQAGIDAGADMVMVSHIVIKSVDKENPASLSEKVHGMLREDLGFEGVIIADDLNMKAILNQMDLGQAAVSAIAAGNDMIFSADFDKTFQSVKKAVINKELSITDIDESVKRILKMKLDLNLITVEETGE